MHWGTSAKRRNANLRKQRAVLEALASNVVFQMILGIRQAARERGHAANPNLHRLWLQLGPLYLWCSSRWSNFSFPWNWGWGATGRGRLLRGRSGQKPNSKHINLKFRDRERKLKEPPHQKVACFHFVRSRTWDGGTRCWQLSFFGQKQNKRHLDLCTYHSQVRILYRCSGCYGHEATNWQKTQPRWLLRHALSLLQKHKDVYKSAETLKAGAVTGKTCPQVHWALMHFREETKTQSSTLETQCSKHTKQIWGSCPSFLYFVYRNL